jgi:abequosyltransferase
MTQPPVLRLSICIPSFNRAAFIGQTLDSIISQATADCEIVISDNASTDDTQKVVQEYASRFDRIRYIKHDTNMGFDRNCDCAVEAARGEYCWLFADDDVMKPGAIATVLKALSQEHSLLLVNGEHKDNTMSSVRIPNFFSIHSDRVYTSDDLDRLFLDVGTCVMCVCCVVIKRSLWISRERQRYYSSSFIHTAVVFQNRIPGTTLVIAEPLMSLRLGNNIRDLPVYFHVWCILWPALVWSFPLAETTKRDFCSANPWKHLRYLLAFRATGQYSHSEYQRWIRPRAGGSLQEIFVPAVTALLPPKLARRLYELCSVIWRWPGSPYDVAETMYPQSWVNYKRSQRKS